VQEGNLKLGSWQMVLWQPRWVFATTDAVCYQKITSDERPIGKEKKIKFTDILKIDELDYGEFQLEVAKRFYTFKAPTSQKCTVRLRDGRLQRPVSLVLLIVARSSARLLPVRPGRRITSRVLWRRSM
jgi:hypothetical protein